ncbi:hypothetical protein HBB16_18905 [Pseudonocardia sp. MCCB 268]|nr:hypothetical protein [Pseudonocardia cytotoxica]
MNDSRVLVTGDDLRVDAEGLAHHREEVLPVDASRVADVATIRTRSAIFAQWRAATAGVDQGRLRVRSRASVELPRVASRHFAEPHDPHLAMRCHAALEAVRRQVLSILFVVVCLTLAIRN